MRGDGLPRGVRDELDVARVYVADKRRVHQERTRHLAFVRICAVPPFAAQAGEVEPRALGCGPHATPILRAMTIAYIGLGSNLGDRAAMLAAAIDALAAHTSVTAVSSVYQTAPWGRRDQPTFLNCCVAIETSLAASDLLAVLMEVEMWLGRVREERWGPRTIDLDLLLFGDEVIASADLSVPHPRLAERAFDLVPLAEIAPTARIAPGGTTVREALAALAREPDDVRRVAPPIVPRSGTAR